MTELFDGRHGGLAGPDRHDARDYLFAAHARLFAPPPARPAAADLTPDAPPVYDQGRLGSCTAWAVRTAREYLTRRAGNEPQPLSPLWLYYETRRKYWKVDVDSGAYMRQAAKILAGRGMALAADWPYDVAKWKTPPPAASYAKALWYRNVNYYRIGSLPEMLDCLASGHPFIFGFPVHANFRQAGGSGAGRVPLPSGPALGGHAVCAIGYRLDDGWEGGGYVLARNSWDLWTADGNLRFPFAFMDDFEVTWDAWTFFLRTEAQPDLPPGP